MGAATGDGDLLAFQRAVPVARIDDRLASAATADLAPGCDPVGQLLVDLLFNQRQICQQRLAVDPLLAQAFADAVLLPRTARLDPRALNSQTVEVGLAQCITLAYLLAPVGNQYSIERQRAPDGSRYGPDSGRGGQRYQLAIRPGCQRPAVVAGQRVYHHETATPLRPV